MPRRDNPWWLDPVPLAAAAIVVSWAAAVAAYRQSLALWPLGVIGTALGGIAVQRGRAIARERQRALGDLADAALAKNRELELLRRLTTSLLKFHDTDELFNEVASVAADLTQAHAAAVMVRSDESWYLRIAGASGALAESRGRLMPADGTFVGEVVGQGTALISNEFTLDRRNHRIPGAEDNFERALAVPLISRGDTIGAVAVYAGPGRAPFSAAEQALLATLGEQVAIGLDRAAMVEEARRSERVLEQTNRELVEATALKSRFLANMSHELRTPLNAIIGFAELMHGDHGLTEAQRDYLESIARNGRHLLSVIETVLENAKAESGRMTLRLARFDLTATVAAAVQDTESLRATKRQACRLQLEQPLEVVADEQKVRQVLFNLLSNAAKFTDTEGEVTVSALRTRMPFPDTDPLVMRDAVWLAVRDTGVGIAGEDLPKLFRPFSQVEAETGQGQRGTGLGLALCKQFVESHGGTIGVESVVGSGSTFWLVLPAEGPPTESPVDPKAAAGLPPR
jgi:signal transduction histidine kinase